MKSLFQDVRYGLRMLRKSPGFTAVAVITLALGIGANVAIFSVVNALLLRPLPYHDPSRLVSVTQIWPAENDARMVPSPDWANWRTQSASFTDLAAYDVGDNPTNLTGSGDPLRLEAAYISANTFNVLGVRPELGRNFLSTDDQPAAAPVTILTYDLWQRRFSLDPHIVGTNVTLDGQSFTVVGVMPRSLHFPEQGVQPDCFLPFRLPLHPDWSAQRMAIVRVLGRLRPGVSIQQAAAELNTINARAASAVPVAFARMRVGQYVQILPLQRKLVGDVRPALLVLLGAVGFVLLIACANIANLQTARTVVRQRELAVRVAIGADRLRLIRQLLTEGGLLALLGGAVGMLVAIASVHALLAYAPQNIAQTAPISVNSWVLAFAFLLTAAAGILFGLLPALGAANPDLSQTLKEGSPQAQLGWSRGLLRRLLIVSELAMALILLVGSGLLIRSFIALTSVPLGLDPGQTLTAKIALPESKYSTSQKQQAFYSQLLANLAHLPGVKFAALASYNRSSAVRIEGEPLAPAGAAPFVLTPSISEDYFRCVRIPLVAGRFFNTEESPAALSVIVNKYFAEHFFRGQNPVGKRLKLGSPTDPWRQIVGVVGDAREFGAPEDIQGEVYTPYQQDTRVNTTILLRAAHTPLNLAAVVREQVAAIDPNQPIYEVTSMQQALSRTLDTARFNTVLLAIFAALAVLLAVIGIYGVIAYFVSQRTREVGIRIALGASTRDVLRLVMGQGLGTTALGLAFGVAGSLALSRYLSSLLYAVRPTDPMTIAGASLVLGAVALLASYIPARRAAKVDPMVALRYE